MRQRTKLPIPEPGPSEFKNFDRLVGILIAKKPPVKRAKAAVERPAKAQNTAC
jgi:hypothetical protein